MKQFFAYFCSLLLALLVWACDKQDSGSQASAITGSGEYTFMGNAAFENKPMQCFYHIPTNSTSMSPIFIVIHGSGRDAQELRDELIMKANQKGFIVLAPEFSQANFPGSSAFNLANIFEDGDNPSVSTLNPESDWTFSVIDPIFEDFKRLCGNANAVYDVFGHSAGAQLIHRFLLFQPEAKFNRLVCSAAGWYALPNSMVDFPYGLRKSPAEGSNPQTYFGRSAFIIVGENDTDPNSFSLRHTPESDLQGLNRLERARYFYQESFVLAQNAGFNFNWQFKQVNNTAHEGVVLAKYAADLLY